MAKISEIMTPADYTSLSNEIRTTLIEKGVLSNIALNIGALCTRIIPYKYSNVDIKFTQTQAAAFIATFRQYLSMSIIPDFLIEQSFKFGHKETYTKTGTESDAGSFDNDPTTNDEYRSYPFDTTASDVQSKTRSIVNGAESGTNSNTKTYNTTDSRQIQEQAYEIEKQYSDIVYEYTENFVRQVIQLLRTSHTLIDPLTDDATLFELEY